MLQNKQKRGGRPRLERLKTLDVEFIKKTINEKFNSLIAFYERVYTEAKLPKYRDLDPPRSVETIDRTFDDAFSRDLIRRRSLPKFYWKVLEELLNITPESLKLRRQVLRQASTQNKIPETKKSVAGGCWWKKT